MSVDWTTTDKTYPHGDDRRYVFNRCRCRPCTDAHATAARTRRRLIAYGRWRGYIPATGTIRRLRALTAAGWAATHIADHLDLDPSWIRALIRGDHPRVHADTADRFANLYQRLADVDGPSRLARRRAERAGWPGPWAWPDETLDDPAAEPVSGDGVDWVAVDRALSGHRVALTAEERHHAVHVGCRRGMTVQQVADALHMSWRKAKTLAYLPLPDEAVAA